MIDLEKDDGVWTVTINRPEKANSLTLKMLPHKSHGMRKLPVS